MSQGLNYSYQHMNHHCCILQCGAHTPRTQFRNYSSLEKGRGQEGVCYILFPNATMVGLMMLLNPSKWQALKPQSSSCYQSLTVTTKTFDWQNFHRIQTNQTLHFRRSKNIQARPDKAQKRMLHTVGGFV